MKQLLGIYFGIDWDDIMNRYALPILGLMTGLLSLTVRGSDLEINGNIGFELRYFDKSAQFSNQFDDFSSSISLEPEAFWKSDDGQQRVNIILFHRWDEHDNERTHSDIRELYWGYESDEWDLLIGINKVFWGVTESNHLVDIINSTDFVEDIDGEDKLGQPMINLNLQREWGSFGIYVLPYFRKTTQPGQDGRLRPALVVDSDSAEFESSNEERHTDFALRYSHYIGDMDLGLSIFRGTSREARLVPNATFSKLIPNYDLINQFGMDIQYTRDQWLWKLEALYRESDLYEFTAATGGFEYTQFQMFGSNFDIGWVFEWQYDDRPNNAPFTLADNDLFLATRLTFNDSEDTSILAGASIDQNTEEVFFNVEGERRLSDSLTGSIRIRVFSHVDETSSLSSFRSDDYLQLRINWFF